MRERTRIPTRSKSFGRWSKRKKAVGEILLRHQKENSACWRRSATSPYEKAGSDQWESTKEKKDGRLTLGRVLSNPTKGEMERTRK